MRTYPVTVETELTIDSRQRRLLKYIVRVEAGSRREARETAEAEFTDYMNEKRENASVGIDYRILKLTIQDDPYIYRADKPPAFEPVGRQPNVMGIPAD